MSKIICCVVTAGLLSLSAFTGSTWAQDRNAERAIKHRRAAFALMSTYFSRLLQTVEGDRPFDPGQVMSDAQIVEQLSRLPWEGFAPGSERGDTRAKEDIWLEEDRFKQLSQDMQARTAELSQAASTGDLAKLKSAFAKTRETCNTCHKEFRSGP